MNAMSLWWCLTWIHCIFVNLSVTIEFSAIELQVVIVRTKSFREKTLGIDALTSEGSNSALYAHFGGGLGGAI